MDLDALVLSLASSIMVLKCLDLTERFANGKNFSFCCRVQIFYHFFSFYSQYKNIVQPVKMGNLRGRKIPESIYIYPIMMEFLNKSAVSRVLGPIWAFLRRRAEFPDQLILAALPHSSDSRPNSVGNEQGKKGPANSSQLVSV